MRDNQALEPARAGLGNGPQRLAAPIEAGLAITAEQDLETVLQTILEQAAAITGARYAALGVLGEDEQELERFLTAGIDERSARRIGEHPRGRGILGALFSESGPLRLDDLSADPRAAGFPKRHPSMRTFLGAPILLHGEPAGGVYLTEKDSGQPFTEEDEATCLLLASQAGIAIETARLHETVLRQEGRYRSLMEAANEGIGVLDADNRVSFVNPRLAEMLGCSMAEMMSRPLTDFMDEEWQAVLHARLERRRQGLREQADFKLRRKDGSELWAIVSAAPLTDGQGGYAGTVATVTDVTERRQAALDLSEVQARYRALVEQLPTITYTAPLEDLRLTHYVSPQAEALLGFSPAEFESDPDLWVRRLHPEDRERTVAVWRAAGEAPLVMEYRWRSRDEREVWLLEQAVVVRDEAGVPMYRQGVIFDITERKRSDQRIAHLAYHDELTGLANRTLFQDHLDLALARARRHGRAVAVLYFDLDRFKLVNDTLGHSAGDDMLRRVAESLSAVVRAEDLLARHSGDEFLVLLGDLEPETAAAAAQAAAGHVHAALDRPFSVEGQDYHMDASIGIGLFPSGAADSEAILKQADMAMYASKRSGPGGTLVYAPAGFDPAAELSLASRLWGALERGEYTLHYQPIVDIESAWDRDQIDAYRLPNHVVGVEALIRWQDPQGGLVEPAQFIPLAEEIGLMEQIGDWVVGEACRQWGAWRDQGLRLRMAVNMSARQLRQPNLVERLLAAASAAGMDPGALEIEIIESAAMEDTEQTAGILRELHGAGLRCAIDDFGAGHSSLSRLRQIPVDRLKIDRSFVQDVPDDGAAAAMVAGVVQIARSLGVQSLAEGIETKEQWGFLVQQGCRLGQGYLFSRPVPAEAIAELLAERAFPAARRRPAT